MLLFPVFSTIANAENIEVGKYSILQTNAIKNNQGTNKALGLYAFTPHNTVQEKWEQNKSADNDITYNFTRHSAHYQSVYQIKYDSGDVILKSGKDYTVNFNNFYHSLLVGFRGVQFYVRNINQVKLMVTYADGTLKEVNTYEIQQISGTPNFNLNWTFSPDKDVTTIELCVISDIGSAYPSSLNNSSNGHLDITSYYGEVNGDDKYNFSIEVATEEAGLLKSVIQWLSGIKDKIQETLSSVSGGFSNVISGLGNIVNNIIELPAKLWTSISNGLKELFVPNEKQLEDYSNDWDMLLSQRFGALYESGEIMSDIVNNVIGTQVMLAEETGEIDIPLVSLNSYGIPFSFGGYSVNIIPQGFDFLVVICKRIISVCCTLLFVNALRKKYESVMGG